MRSNFLSRLLMILIVIIIIISGTVIIIIIRGPVPGPFPGPGPDPAPWLNAVKFLSIAEVLLGIVSLGLFNRIKNNQKF